MKSIISLLLCSLLIGCVSTQATEITQKPILTPPQETQQETQQEVRPHGQAFLLAKSIICNDSKVIYSLLKNEPVSEVPIFFGLILNEHGVAKMVNQIFVGKKSNSTFSVIESSNEGISCIISAGTGFDILPHYHEGEIQRGSGQEVNKGIWKMPQNVRMQN